MQGIFQDLEHGGIKQVNQPLGVPSLPSFPHFSIPIPPHSAFLRSKAPQSSAH